jgi:hypothetical protein
MNSIEKLLCSAWFWLDILLSVSGGLVVWWGLVVEKKAEKFVIPSDFKQDIFQDLVDEQKKQLERGWRILMTGIVIEVIAALGISVMSGLEIADLTDKTANANLAAKQAESDSSEARKQAGEANERAANTESNNLVLQTLVLKLEAKSRWRTIEPEQKRNFIELTKKVLPFPIRVRMASNANAETESYGNRIRELLDAAGFIETNKDLAIANWPPQMNILWSGTEPELPSIVFLNNISTLGKVVDLQNAQKKLKTYPSYLTNTTVATEFILSDDDSDPEAYVTDTNGIPTLHLKFPEHAPFQISRLQSVQSAFNAIGIQSGWMTSTNIPAGMCEVFINPK